MTKDTKLLLRKERRPLQTKKATAQRETRRSIKKKFKKKNHKGHTSS